MDIQETLAERRQLSQLLSSLPAAVITWLEMQAVKGQFSCLIKQSATHDGWYVSRNGETEGPETLPSVFHRLIQGEAPLAILHESDGAADEPQWRSIAYRAWKSNKPFAVLWMPGFWLITAVVGWVIICLVLPYRVRAYGEWTYWLAVCALAAFYLAGALRAKLSKPKGGVEIVEDVDAG